VKKKRWRYADRLSPLLRAILASFLPLSVALSPFCALTRQIHLCWATCWDSRWHRLAQTASAPIGLWALPLPTLKSKSPLSQVLVYNTRIWMLRISLLCVFVLLFEEHQCKIRSHHSGSTKLTLVQKVPILKVLFSVCLCKCLSTTYATPKYPTLQTVRWRGLTWLLTHTLNLNFCNLAAAIQWAIAWPFLGKCQNGAFWGLASVAEFLAGMGFEIISLKSWRFCVIPNTSISTQRLFRGFGRVRRAARVYNNINGRSNRRETLFWCVFTRKAGKVDRLLEKSLLRRIWSSWRRAGYRLL